MIWKKIFNSPSESITGAAIILASTSLISRLLGFARDRVLAHYFGAGDVIDAYYAAFKIPDLTYNLIIIGAFSAGFIPVFTKLFNKNGLFNIDKEKNEAWKLVNNAVNSLGFFLIILTVTLIIIAPLLIPFIAPGFEGEKRDLTIKLTRIMLLSPLLLGLSTVVGAVLQSLKNFFVYSLSPMMYNIGIIIGVIFLVPIFGYAGLAWGVILGAVLHLLVQLPTFFGAGYKYNFFINIRDKNLITVIKLIIPRTLGLAAGQVNNILMTMMATTLAVGSLAIYSYANNLQSLPLGLIGITFAIAAFPTLTLFVANNDKQSIIKTVSSTTRQILFFTIPLSIVFLMLRAQIVRVVLGTGAFDWDATIKTSDTLAFFALSLFAQSLIPLLARTFYAFEDSITPFLVGIFAAIFDRVAAWYLINHNFGVEGLALAFSLGAVINMALLWVILRFKLKTLNEKEILSSLFKISIASIFMGLSIQLFKNLLAPIINMQTFFGIFMQGAISGTIGLVVYVLIALLLKSPEMQTLTETIKRKLVKKQVLPQDISDITLQ